MALFQATLTSGDTIYLVPDNVLSVRSEGSGSAIKYVDVSTKAEVYSVTESASTINSRIEQAQAAASQTAVKSTLNSTETPLDAGNTWTGTGEQCVAPAIMTTVETDQDGMLSIQISLDNSNWTTIGSYSYRAGETTNRPHIFQQGTRYFRIRFENTSSSNQTYLRIYTDMGNFDKLTAPANGTYVRDADTVPMMPLNEKFTRARGRFDGILDFTKFGYNDDIDTASSETVWNAGGTWTPMIVAETLNVSSTSTNDTSAGTGARSILITGVGAVGEPQTETLVLTGTAEASTSNTWLGVNRVEVASAGSLRYNAGNITLSSTTYGTQGYIRAQESITQQLIFTVPSTARALITRIVLNVAKTSGGVSPKVTVTLYERANGVRYAWFQDTIDVSLNSFIDEHFENAFEMGAGSRWWMQVSTNTNDTFVRGRVEQTLVDVAT